MKRALFLIVLLIGAGSPAWGGVAPEALPLFPGSSELDPAVYPLGWAQNGTRLALLVAQPHEAADERDWRVYVTDLVSDEVVFSKTIGFVPDGKGVSSFWNAHGEEIEGICRDQGVSRSGMELHLFPAITGNLRGTFYELAMDVTRGVEPDFGYRGISKLKITMTKDGTGTKTILEKSWTKWFPLAAGSLGYIPNPDRSRIAVLTGLVERGYEGAPHPRRLLITGARIGEKF